MFGERWQQILKTQGDTIALWHSAGAVTYRELEKLARALLPDQCPQLGSFYLAQGDGLQITTALLAAFLSGYPVQVVEKDRQRRIPTCPPPAGTALIKQTVGSSGVRRCQFFRMDQVAADVDRLHAALGLADCDVALAPLSVAHSFGLTTTVLQTLLNGLPTHWLPTPFPTGLKDALADKTHAFLPGVPAMWKAWLIAGLDLSHVHLAVSAGSSLTLELESGVKASFGLKLHNLYGTSECGAISYDASQSTRSLGSDLGALLSGVTAFAGAEGRLLVHSDAVGLGYDETLADEVFHPPQHLTSDIIQITGSQLHFERCVGKGINVASRKLSPSEIAAKITESLGGLSAMVSGVPSRDPERVQEIVCHVPIPPEALTQEFKAEICATLAPWEVPRRWTSLPADSASC